MDIVILSPDSKLYEGKASSLQLTGTEGGFEILEGHAPLIASLAKGELSVKVEGGQTLRFSADNGFVECLNNRVSLLLQGAKAL